MKKVEFLLDGPEEADCAELIRDLGYAAVQHCDVDVVNIYCGHAPKRKGYDALKLNGPAGLRK